MLQWLTQFGMFCRALNEGYLSLTELEIKVRAQSLTDTDLQDKQPGNHCPFVCLSLSVYTCVCSCVGTHCSPFHSVCPHQEQGETFTCCKRQLKANKSLPSYQHNYVSYNHYSRSPYNPLKYFFDAMSYPVLLHCKN